MSDKIQQARRAAFEAWADKDHLIHNGSEYENPYVESAWMGFNAALDAVEIDLDMRENRSWGYGLYKAAVEDCRAAIEQTNMGIKIK